MNNLPKMSIINYLADCCIYINYLTILSPVAVVSVPVLSSSADTMIAAVPVIDSNEHAGAAAGIIIFIIFIVVL